MCFLLDLVGDLDMCQRLTHTALVPSAHSELLKILVGLERELEMLIFRYKLFHQIQ
jgi:hypothetical protein